MAYLTVESGPALDKTPSAGVRASVAMRVQRWVVGSLERMSDEEVLKLVEAQSPAETIAEIVAAAADAGSGAAGGWAELLLRGAEAKSSLAERAGGLLSSSAAAQVLRISVQGVKQRLERRKLVAVPLSGGQRGFPALQFQPDGHVRPGIADVAQAGAHIDPWVLLSILLDDVEGEPGGALIEHLDDPAVRADVLGRLATYGEHAAT